jgi:CDP-glucose 4,6-dehydratase
MEGLVIMLEFYKNKRVLVTGHTGFKGSWLCKILSIAGADVIGVSLEPDSDLSLFNILDIKNDIKSIILDIRKLDELKKVFIKNKPEIVFHLAAQPLVRESYNNPVYTYETNIMGTVNLLESIRLCDSVKSIVNITTDKVYSNKEWEWPYRETDELNGFDPYSNSKSCSELITSSYKNSFFNENKNISISTARAGNVIGGGDFAKDRIIPDCVRAGIDKKEIIVRNLNSIRPYQHVFEALSAYLIIAQKQYNDKSFEGSYNIGPNEDGCITTKDLVDLFCESWGNIKWINKSEENKFHESSILKLDCSKIKNSLGWKPKLSIEEAVDLTVEWSKGYYLNDNINEISKLQIIKYFTK